jgi:hypothetical protein
MEYKVQRESRYIQKHKTTLPQIINKTTIRQTSMIILQIMHLLESKINNRDLQQLNGQIIKIWRDQTRRKNTLIFVIKRRSSSNLIKSMIMP